MPIFFTRGRITPPGHARPRSWEPRYAAQREASMAESLAYVAARTWPQGESAWWPVSHWARHGFMMDKINDKCRSTIINRCSMDILSTINMKI